MAPRNFKSRANSGSLTPLRDQKNSESSRNSDELRRLIVYIFVSLEGRVRTTCLAHPNRQALMDQEVRTSFSIFHCSIKFPFEGVPDVPCEHPAGGAQVSHLIDDDDDKGATSVPVAVYFTGHVTCYL